ncbi:MAG: hypothetical protein KDC98_17765, partial [Planctomycetes bacterium]|nr:hypothetical protein [Planctomycetota bacterium]
MIHHPSFVFVPLLIGAALAVALPAQQSPNERLDERLDEILVRLQRIEARIDKVQGAGAPIDTIGPTDAATRLRWFDHHAEMAANSPHRALPWHFLGPDDTSGRVTDIASPMPRGRSAVLYVATASGGVWKTVNEGTTWEPVFEHEATASIGDVTVDPSDPEVIWVGTGEANIFRSSMAGTGVYRS